MSLINIFTKSALKKRDEKIKKEVEKKYSFDNLSKMNDSYVKGRMEGYENGCLEANSSTTKMYLKEIDDIKTRCFSFLKDIKESLEDINTINNSKALKSEKQTDINTSIEKAFSIIKKYEEEEKL